MRPVDEVIGEIRHARCRQIFFADGTFVGSRTRTMELMERLLPLKIRWSTLWNVHRVLDPELMELAKKIGLLHINMGVESIRPETLGDIHKTTTPAHRLEEVIKILRRLDISFSFNLIFGWDTDRWQDFEATSAFLDRNKVHVAFFNVFSPHKGTKIYDRFLAEGRLRDPWNMGRCPGVIAEIHPKSFSAEELEAGIQDLYRRFYAWPSILHRLPVPRSKSIDGILADEHLPEKGDPPGLVPDEFRRHLADILGNIASSQKGLAPWHCPGFHRRLATVDSRKET